MQELEAAYVLHRRPYRETSLLVDFFTYQRGCVSAVARGAQRPRCQWRYILQPFTPLTIQTRGQRQLLTLSQAESRAPSFILEGVAWACAFYLNELLFKLLPPYDAHSRLFNIYEYSLDALARDERVDIWLRWFEYQLLAELGYGLNLFSDRDGWPLEPTNYYIYNHQDNHFVQTHETASAFPGDDLIALRDQAWLSRAQCQRLRRLLQPLIWELLGDKTLYSRQLIPNTS